MWIFEVSFNNMDDCSIRKVTLNYEEQMYNDEQLFYMQAVKEAFEMKRDNEAIGNIEFIAN